MSHCDQDTLSLLALGEPPAPGDQSHLDGCAECTDELAQLRAVVTTARAELSGVLVHEADGKDATEGTPVTRIPPPPRVWEQIAAATGVTARPRPEVVIASSMPEVPAPDHPLASRNGAGLITAQALSALEPGSQGTEAGTLTPSTLTPSTLTPGDTPAPAGPQAEGPAQRVQVPATTRADALDGAGLQAGPDELGAITPGQLAQPALAADAGPKAPRPAPRASGRSLPRQRRESGTLIGIGVVALIVGLLGGFGLSAYLNEKPAPVASPAVVAGTSLIGLPLAPAAAGQATVIQTSAGRKLDVDVRRLDSTSGFYEVWLINPSVTRMVSVGILQGSRGEFTVPEGIDLSQFPLVDISIQGYDSNGGHSGKSVLRGSLRV